jgi:hypothetical protein
MAVVISGFCWRRKTVREQSGGMCWSTSAR